MKVTYHDPDFTPDQKCAECGEVITGKDPFYEVDGDVVCARPDCGPAFAELASPEGQERLKADRDARPAQYR